MMGFHAFCFICLFFLFNPNLTQQLQKGKKNIHPFSNGHICSERYRETWGNGGFLLHIAGEMRRPAPSAEWLSTESPESPAAFISEWSRASVCLWRCAVTRSVAHAFVAAKAGG